MVAVDVVRVYIACLYTKFGGTAILLDVLKKGAKFLDVGLIADIHNLAKVWIA